MSEPLLEVLRLRVKFGAVPVLEELSFVLHKAETLGLVGESGSGKSTLARAILRLIPAAGGRILWYGEDLLALGPAALRRRRRDLQMVFQDPMASLNPRMTVGDALAEPLKIFEAQLGPAARQARIEHMLQRVGLSAAMQRRYPHEFSGGQCQRIGIARAMMLRPQVLICDEPVSALDVSVQGQIVNLLADLQGEFGTAILFISHNLAVVRHLSHRVLVIYRGRLVEVAPRDELFAGAAHPYTRTLLAAVPDPSRAAAGAGLTVGEVPAALSSAGGGCVFHDRCAYRRQICLDAVPILQEVDTGHSVACHRWREVVYS